MSNEKAFNYKLFFENIPNAYCITNLDLQMIDANKAFLRLFEVDTLNELSTNFESLLSKDTLQNNDFSVLKNGLNNYQFSGYLALAFDINLLVNWHCTVDSINNQIYILGTLEPNNKIKSLPENKKAKFGGWDYIIETEELRWSEEVYHIHEEESDKPITLTTAINYYYKDDNPLISELFANLLEKGITYDEELRIVTAKGNVKWVRANGKVILKNNKPYKLQGNFLDIHHRKLTEIKLEQHKILLQKILDSLPIGVFWKDENRVYAGFNENSTKFFRKSLDELLGKRDEDIITDVTLLNQIKAQDEAILLHKKRFSETRVVKIREEKERIVDIQKLPLINKDGEVFGILGVFIDITQLTNLVNSLKRKNNELQELLFAVSHDLKEPLKAINRFVQLLKKRYGSVLEGEGKFIVDSVLKEAHRQYLQFNGLARLLEVGNEEHEMGLLSLNEIIYESINTMKFDDKTMPDFEITLDNALQLTYYKYDLITIFQELITNAIKFRQSDKKIKIDISVKDEITKWKIIVSDNGEGFDIRLKNKVFMIFQKLSNKYYYEGVGIGLPICKKIIENYGGEINVEASKFHGISFNFTIPKNIAQKEELSLV
jgi:signal transduction histidine kinase